MKLRFLRMIYMTLHCFGKLNPDEKQCKDFEERFKTHENIEDKDLFAEIVRLVAFIDNET